LRDHTHQHRLNIIRSHLFSSDFASLCSYFCTDTPLVLSAPLYQAGAQLATVTASSDQERRSTSICATWYAGLRAEKICSLFVVMLRLPFHCPRVGKEPPMKKSDGVIGRCANKALCVEFKFWTLFTPVPLHYPPSSHLRTFLPLPSRTGNQSNIRTGLQRRSVITIRRSPSKRIQ
jgi:hypothetical protein